ncbi:hypothetical protein [Winogradskyella sp. PG-2]|uniref:hypothetical protein n=1 Tax=Winogradskyella sp. PG-2 TaxID=754409 RepID=UPI00045878BD|nr:hypothetical protein [Winogradskyella sp. PG-2]BAO74344.1 hypothetical protein WPG_0114 [Winogradskyella sp. PG-2]
MKSNILIFSMVLLLTFSCKNKPKSDIEPTVVETVQKEKANGLKGTWELVGFYNYKDNIVVDSFKTSDKSRQLKMYTDTKVMWSKHKPADSSEWFGYGTYSYKDDMLTEILEFGSAVMDQVIAEKKEFTFELTLSPNKFQQIELDEDGNRIYSENYIRVE